ncbi:MAG: alpha/beta hydrolase [Candidatus Eremiobacteraeota bacterium]|nr:alpha/beta hydrolase [Candidatus Eremiobacteraeota bacterium]
MTHPVVSKLIRSVLAGAALLALFAAATPSLIAHAQAGATAKPTIVLVHGAWADGSSWDGVISRLQRDGYTVLAPPNPLRGIEADATYLAGFLKTIDGPIVLVGHSYGGMVTSAAATGNEEVKALVYVDAYVPDAGDSVLSLTSERPGSRLSPDAFAAVPFKSAAGGDADLYIKPAAFESVFASDLPRATADAMFAAQRPFANSALSEKASGAPAWKSIPSWYLIGDADRVIPPATQLAMAQRAKATVTHVNGGHTALVSHPDQATAVILAAAKSVTR